MKISPKNYINFSSTRLRYTDKENSPVYCITCYFRDDTNWEFLTHYLAEKYKNENQVNVIDIACSDGSEAYSLAMILDDRLKDESQKFFPIKGYDINPEIVEMANRDRSILTQDDCYRINSTYHIDFEKYFKPHAIRLNNSGNMLYFIKPNLKEKTTFECKDALSVLKDLPDNTKNTVIFFKNALPYIKPQEREEIYELLGQKLQEGSIVIFGDYDYNLYYEIQWALSEKGFSNIRRNLQFEKTSNNANYSDCAKAQALYHLD